MRIPSNKVKDIIRFFEEELSKQYSASEIQVFIQYCFEAYSGILKHELVLKKNESVNESTLLKYAFAVKELKANKPIQYIIGVADFYGLKFKVNEDVLIPRQETEELVQLIINENNGGKPQVLDIGTGSGCIAISLKKNIPHAKVSAYDISPSALAVAKENCDRNSLAVAFNQTDILTPQVDDKRVFDIIVSNPPYVREKEKQAMHLNVLNYEPSLALFVNDQNPLVYYKAIGEYALKHLTKEGVLYFEISEYLGEETKQLLEKMGFSNIRIHKDLNGKNRILRCKK